MCWKCCFLICFLSSFSSLTSSLSILFLLIFLIYLSLELQYYLSASNTPLIKVHLNALCMCVCALNYRLCSGCLYRKVFIEELQLEAAKKLFPLPIAIFKCKFKKSQLRVNLKLIKFSS